MKLTLISTLVVLALLLCVGLLTAGKGAETSRAFIEESEALARLVEGEDWQAAERAARDMIERWERESPLLQTFLIHEDIDDINILLASLDTAVTAREGYQAMLFLARLDESFGHLKHRDAFALKNIL